VADRPGHDGAVRSDVAREVVDAWTDGTNRIAVAA
jgi:hypothetical protein